MPLLTPDDPDVPSLGERLMALAGWILLLLALGVLPFLVFQPGTEYLSLTKPTLRLPASAYPLLWSSLYITQAFALWLMRMHAESDDTVRRRASVLFSVQYALHLLWAPLMFGLHSPLLLSVCLAALLVPLLLAAYAFARIRLLSACLLLPWLAWVGYSLWFALSLWSMNHAQGA